MTGIVILGVVLLVLALILLTPVQLRLSYDRGKPAVSVRCGPLGLYPRRGKKPPEAEEKKKAAPAPGKRPALNAEQIRYSLETLPPILGRALRRVGRRLSFQPLKVHLLVAGTDPADTAQLYGKLQAVLSGGLPVLHRLVRIREQDIQLFLDFQAEQPDCIADIGIRLRLWDMLVTALCAGGGVLRWLVGFRKLADAPGDRPEKESAQTGAA